MSKTIRQEFKKRAEGPPTLTHQSATARRVQGLPEVRLRQSYPFNRTLHALHIFFRSEEYMQLTQKLRTYANVWARPSSFDGRICTVSEIIPSKSIYASHRRRNYKSSTILSMPCGKL